MVKLIEKTGKRSEDDKLFLRLVASLLSKDDKLITNLSNLSALLFCYFDDISWAGFYLLDEDKLILGPFQGLPACTEIKLGRGVCGKAYEQMETLIVPDVNTFPFHIACDSLSRSEIVIPLEGFGVLDLDSRSSDRFDEEDAKVLKEVMNLLSQVL